MYRILGISDDHTTCEHCGKSNLKCTVTLESLDADSNGDGITVRFGRDCAARAMRGSNKPSEVKSIEDTARGIEYARKWLGVTPQHTASVVARRVLLTTPCRPVGEFAIEFSNGVVVTASRSLSGAKACH